MRIPHQQARTPNSAANPLSAPFWRPKFRCGESPPDHAKIVMLLLFSSFRGALLTVRQVFSLSSGKRLLGGGEMRALPAQFGDALAGVEIGPVDERKVGDLARVVGAIGNADLFAGDVHGADPLLVLQQPDV